MSFTPVSRERISDRVARELRAAILEGRYGTGDLLPGERNLAESFGVNRGTVREALRDLERAGLVERRHGEGSRVLDLLSHASLALLPELIAPGGRLDPRMLIDVLELRVELGSYGARAAAERRSEEHLAVLREGLEALKAAGSRSEIQRLDFAFFETLIEASGNRPLRLLMGGLRRAYSEHLELFAALYPLPFDPSEHERMLAAAVAGDGAAAELAARNFLSEAVKAISGED